MNKPTILAIIGLSLGLTATGCSTATNTSTSTATANVVNQTAANTAVVAGSSAPASNHATGADEDAPANVKAVFPDAQSFAKQHKDISKDAIAEIEKQTGGKVPDADHHSYLAFATAGGVRKQIGAATVVKADGREIVVVYENQAGMPVIKEVRADSVPTPFLKQFAGKGHDDEFQVGGDLKANGFDENSAKTIARAVRIDSLTMQKLFGAAHTH